MGHPHLKKRAISDIRWQEHIRDTRGNTIGILKDIAIPAGEFRNEGFKGGSADTIILATARTIVHKGVTGDPLMYNFTCFYAS